MDTVSSLSLAAQPSAGSVPSREVYHHPGIARRSRLGWRCCLPGCSPSSITPHVSADRRPGASLGLTPGPPLLVEQPGSVKMGELGLRMHPSESLSVTSFLDLLIGSPLERMVEGLASVGT